MCLVAENVSFTNYFKGVEGRMKKSMSCLFYLLLSQQQPSPLCVLIAARVLIKQVPLWYTDAGQRVPHIEKPEQHIPYRFHIKGMNKPKIQVFFIESRSLSDTSTLEEWLTVEYNRLQQPEGTMC